MQLTKGQCDVMNRPSSRNSQKVVPSFTTHPAEHCRPTQCRACHNGGRPPHTADESAINTPHLMGPYNKDEELEKRQTGPRKGNETTGKSGIWVILSRAQSLLQPLLYPVGVPFLMAVLYCHLNQEPRSQLPDCSWNPFDFSKLP